MESSSGRESTFGVDRSRRIDEVHKTGGAEFTLAQWLRASIPDQDGLDLQSLEMEFWHATAFLSPMPYIEEALQEIRDAQIPMGAVSNAIFSGLTLRSELEKHGLAWAFDFVISSADLKIRKPDPRIFNQALTNMDIAASSA